MRLRSLYFLVSLLLTACSSAIFSPPDTATPTITLTVTPSATPSLTPTPTPTFTPTPFPIPVDVVFKFDDGVSLEQQKIIQQGVALAQEYFGQAGTITIYAYANLDRLTEEYSRRNNVFTNSVIAINFKERFQNNTLGLATTGVIYVYVSDRWIRSSLSSRLSTMAHEYFHAYQRSLSSLLEGEGGYWLIEGSAEWASYRALASYGLASLEEVRKQKIDRTRGLVSPLSSMETLEGANQEDDLGKYTLGYLASEFLASLVGDEVLFKKYWSGLRFSPGWKAGFQSAFGLSTEQFYSKFEEYRLAQFPPFCGKVGDPLPPKDSSTAVLQLDRKNAPHSFAIVSDPNYIPYIFCVRGFRLSSLTSNQLSSTFKLPTRNSSVNLCGGNCIVLSMSPNISSGTYAFTVELPDGRKLETKFDHTGVSATATLQP